MRQPSYIAANRFPRETACSLAVAGVPMRRFQSKAGERFPRETECSPAAAGVLMR